MRIGSTVATGASKTLASKKIHLERIFSSQRNAVVLVSPHLARPGHARNGLECNTFWERIWEYYNKNCQACDAYWSMRSLETKWGIYKHDVSKFIRNFGTIWTLKLSSFPRIMCKLWKHLENGHRILQVKASKGLELYFLSLFVGFERHPLLGQHAHWCDHNIKSQNNA